MVVPWWFLCGCALVALAKQSDRKHTQRLRPPVRNSVPMSGPWPESPVADSSTAGSPVFALSSQRTPTDVSWDDSTQLLDLADRHAKLRANAQFEARLRREAWVQDYRQVLHGLQAPSAKAYAEIAAGWHPNLGPDKKQLDEEQVRSREELKEAKEKARAEEKRRIRRENFGMRSRIINIQARTDNDVRDDASGAARRRSAAHSAERRRLEQETLQRSNAAMKLQLQNTKAATDNDALGAQDVDVCEPTRQATPLTISASPLGEACSKSTKVATLTFPRS